MRKNSTNSSEKYGIPQKRKVLTNLILLSASLIVTFMLIEICYRLYISVAHPLIIMTPDGGRFNPNGVGKYRGAKVSLDEFAFRNGIDHEAWIRKRRIMLIGDSIGFGLGINDEKTISHLLNENLSSHDIGVLNLCQPGLDTPALRDHLFKYGTKLGPWNLIVWMYCINDAKTSTVYRPPKANNDDHTNFIGKFQHFIFHIFKWPFVLKPKVKQLMTRMGLLKKERQHSSWESYYAWCISSYDLNSNTRKNENSSFQDVVDWSSNNSARLIVVLAPSETQFVDGNTSPQDFIKELCQIYNVSYIDLMPYLLEAKKKERVFLPGDKVHLNSNGTKIVSNIIGKWLVSNGYIKNRG